MAVLTQQLRLAIMSKVTKIAWQLSILKRRMLICWPEPISRQRSAKQMKSLRLHFYPIPTVGLTMVKLYRVSKMLRWLNALLAQKQMRQWQRMHLVALSKTGRGPRTLTAIPFRAMPPHHANMKPLMPPTSCCRIMQMSWPMLKLHYLAASARTSQLFKVPWIAHSMLGAPSF